MALLEIKNVTHFFGGLRAVYNLNLTLNGGELMGLIGPNGAGKTTVFNLMSGFYRPSEGEIRFMDRDISGSAAPSGNVAGNRAHVPEYPPLEQSERFRKPLRLPASSARLRLFALGPAHLQVPEKRAAG